VMFWCASAMALDESACTDERWGNFEGQTCIGLLEPSDMGEFVDGHFVWSQAFINEADNWCSNANDNWQNDWRPTMATMQIDSARMDYRHRVNQPSDVRFIFQASSNSINAPWLWRVEGPNGERTGYFFMYVDSNVIWSPPGGCVTTHIPEEPWWEPFGKPEMTASDCANTYHDLSVPVYVEPDQDPMTAGAYWQNENGQWYGWNPNPDSPMAYAIAKADINLCCKAWNPPPPSQIQFYTIPGGFVTAADVASIEWNGITVSSGFFDYLFDYTFLNYNTGQNVWQVAGGDYSNQPEIYGAVFGPGTVPFLGDNDVTITLKSGLTVTVTIDAFNIDDMPTVAAITEGLDFITINDKGKSKKKTRDVNVANIIARELDGCLIIQWAEPDGALTRPGMKLRMYVGNNWTDNKPRDSFLFIDCPVQIGTVVIPADIWSDFKAKMVGIGETEVDVVGMYRFQSDGYHNRGYFEGIKFPIQ
jgi:hypothetical protein